MQGSDRRWIHLHRDEVTPAPRIAALDLVRGVAVLGIVAVNIASFARGPSAAFSPDLPAPGSPLDHAAYLAVLVGFEGKMRALFSVLFGASMLLFVERKGTPLQMRRLGWLALIGYLHWLLLWEGDILFLYALAGFAALGLKELKPASLVAVALPMFGAWQIWGAAMWLPSVADEMAVRTGRASAVQRAEYAGIVAQKRTFDADDHALVQAGFAAPVRQKLRDHPFDPFKLVFFNLGETLPYQLIGMALFKAGFFTGWRRRTLARTALAGVATCGAATLAFAEWAAVRGFPEMTMRFALGFGLGFAHLVMALGYAAALVLAAPRLLATGLGRRLQAAGRAAFSNYLGTSMVLAALFYGWGLGLAGRFGAAEQLPFVLGVWALMLAWSAPWLERYKQGPLEWAWRSLTEWRRLPLRR